MARPPKDDDEKKGTYFRFRCTDEEKRLIEKAAAQRSLDASSWGRSELLALAKKQLAKG